MLAIKTNGHYIIMLQYFNYIVNILKSFSERKSDVSLCRDPENALHFSLPEIYTSRKKPSRKWKMREKERERNEKR